MAAAKKYARSENFRAPPSVLSFAQNLFKARAQEGGKPKFGATLIYPTSALTAKVISYEADGKKEMVSLQDIVAKVIVAEWGEKGLERAKQGLIKSPFLAGNGKEARNKTTGELHPGMGDDVFFIRVQANEDRPPVIRYKDPNIPATQEEVYSGCTGFGVINAFAWNNVQNGDGVSFGIQYFQKTADGERIGGSGAIDPEKWHEKIADEGEAPSSTQNGAGAGGLFG